MWEYVGVTRPLVRVPVEVAISILDSGTLYWATELHFSTHMQGHPITYIAFDDTTKSKSVISYYM